MSAADHLIPSEQPEALAEALIFFCKGDFINEHLA
jgi:hypothetical protein